MSIDQPRTPAGSPVGGQFAGIDRPEADVDLDDRPARLLDDTDPATRLDEQTDAALVARARREHKSVSAVIRDVLRNELAKS